MHCNEDNTNEAWCLTCDPDIETRWTSGIKDIDDCIKVFQLRTFAYEDVIEWIPFEKLYKIEIIGVGGFGSIYKATWSVGIRTIEKINFGDDNYPYKRSREADSIVALKTLSSSKLKHHLQCILYGSKLRIYGLTYNSKTNEYLMVFQYANDGSIHKLLQSNFNNLTWKFKLDQLKNISLDLAKIHDANYIHADFHSGNILHSKGTSYVSDLGLSKKKDENSEDDDIYGVMPYVAPEILLGKQQFTQAADIYGLGIVMAEITTGQRPFDGYKFDGDLAIKICNGLRPVFASGTPACYIELARHCMNLNPQKRPSAWYIYWQINDWLKKLASDDESKIKKLFLNADEIIKTRPIIPLKHPNHMYTSKIISTQKILSAVEESKSIDLIDIPASD
ncbi:kinase-like domain-containing protein [Gigaspora rosea]|uniref:Kinase-like domain-containing protein n=1 Tax=Gigaspora rosea TaxID=44941 RepID=A0A397VXW2_9GLOM|nr:kinase-like domain-containing protein [Gigaspora rosea]